MPGTGLVAAARRLSANGARSATFPQQVLGGYSPRAVEAFRREVTRTLAAMETTEQELLAEIRRLNEEAPPAQDTVPIGLMPSDHALNVLAAAQANADKITAESRREADQAVAEARQEAVRIIGEARHQADQVRLHAELQAAEILRQATEQAEAERTRIINEASAESRRTASGFRILGEEMGARLHELAGQLAEQVAEWDKRAAEAQASPPRSRQNGARRPQESAKPA